MFPFFSDVMNVWIWDTSISSHVSDVHRFKLIDGVVLEIHYGSQILFTTEEFVLQTSYKKCCYLIHQAVWSHDILGKVLSYLVCKSSQFEHSCDH